MTETTLRTIHEDMDRYVKAFRLRDPTLLEDVISDECVIGVAVKLDRTTVCLPIADRSVSNTPYGL